MIRRLVALVAFALLVWVQAMPVGAQQPARVAFVVGNAEYGQSPLATALNDAGLVAEALRTVGFEVIEGANLNQVDFVQSFRNFLTKAEAAGPDAVLFIYLSGYGFAFDGENYFAAVDAKLDRESDIPLYTMRLSDLIRSLDGMPARTKVFAVDAARRLPFPLAAAGLPPGLIAVEAPQNFLIGFSAAPGQVVADAAGPYGPYATAIAEMVRAAGLDIAGAFTRIRARTHQLTEGRQTPWEVSALSESVVLVPAEAAAVAPAPAMPVATHERRPFREIGPEEAYAVAIERDELPAYVEFVEVYPRHPYAARIWAIIRARREALAWRRAARINTPGSYWTYLQRYPNGIYAADCERRLHRLSAPFRPPPDFVPVEFADVPPPLADEPVGIVEFLPPAPPPPIILIEPGPTYFVDLPPPPPPVWRGGLPAVTVLPVIPRVAPGVRVPIAVQPGLRDSGGGRPPPPQGAIAVPPGPPPGRPQVGGPPPGPGAGRPPGGPPAPGSAPTTIRPGAPAVVTAPPPQPAPSGPQRGPTPPAGAVPPAGQPTPAAQPPAGGPSAPVAT
ncbi:MAG: caspase family protein, partial [Rhodoplanes sp.]